MEEPPPYGSAIEGEAPSAPSADLVGVPAQAVPSGEVGEVGEVSVEMSAASPASGECDCIGAPEWHKPGCTVPAQEKTARAQIEADDAVRARQMQDEQNARGEGEAPVPVVVLGDPHMNNDLLDIGKCASYARTIFCFGMMDTVFLVISAIMHVVNGYLFFLAITLACVIGPIFGMASAKKFNKCMAIIYCVFVVGDIAMRLFELWYFIRTSIISVILQVLFVLVKIWLLTIVVRFIMVLGRLGPAVLDAIRGGQHGQGRFVMS